MDDDDFQQFSVGPAPSHGFQTVQLALGDGIFMHGTSTGQAIEWSWQRVHHHVGLSGKEHLFLKRNQDFHQAAFEDAEIPWGELHYRSKTTDQEARQGVQSHTLESRALVLILALIPSKKNS